MPKSYSVGIVGESNYQAAIRGLREGERVFLLPEPDNPHDPRAIAVRDGEGQTIGYIPRDSWLSGAIIDEGKGSRAVVERIEGGDAGRPSLGVVLAVELGEKGAVAGPTAVPSLKPPVPSSPKQVVGCGIVAIVALLALPTMCSDDAKDAAAGGATSQEGTALASPAGNPAEKAKCAELIEGLVGTGLIRERVAGRIVVEDANWSQIPYKQKVALLFGAHCAETGKKDFGKDETMSAYAYRSGERLLTATESGVF